MKTPTPLLCALAGLAAALPALPLAQDGARPKVLPTPAEARPLLESHLPSALLESGPMGLLWWQWLALPAMVALGALVGWLLGYLSRLLLSRVTARTRNPWDDQFIARAAGPITALWTIAFATAAHPWLHLDGGAAAVLERVLRAATYLTLFWGGFRLVDVGFAALGSGPWARAAGTAGLLPLGRKVSKIALLAIGAVAVLNELGFQVASLLAGLGIGGIALALAAQKTVENLFGSVAIGVDRPFRVGDFVRVEDFVGTVESIGMRSTRFRTLDRTVITIPNGRLADSRSETFAVRDRIRLFTNLALAYDTTAAQMQAVLAGIEAALTGHPRIAADAPIVRFTEFKESALNVEVMAWFATADWLEFTRLRQEVYLRFLEIVRAAGAEFAFPVRTVRLVAGEGAGSEGRATAPGRPGEL